MFIAIAHLCCVSLLLMFIAYLYYIFLLHIYIAYLYCISILHIYIAYLCCCVVVFCRLSLGVDVWSFGGCLESIFDRFGGSEDVLRSLLSGLGGLGPLLGVALGPLLASLEWGTHGTPGTPGTS